MGHWDQRDQRYIQNSTHLYIAVQHWTYFYNITIGSKRPQRPSRIASEFKHCKNHGHPVLLFMYCINREMWVPLVHLELPVWLSHQASLDQCESSTQEQKKTSLRSTLVKHTYHMHNIVWPWLQVPLEFDSETAHADVTKELEKMLSPLGTHDNPAISCLDIASCHGEQFITGKSK